MPPVEMGATHMEKSVTTANLLKVGVPTIGLLDDCADDVQPEFAYCLIAVSEYGDEHVEGIFLNEERARLRKTVLEAEHALRVAKWNEKHGPCQCNNDLCTHEMNHEQTSWFVRTARLHR